MYTREIEPPRSSPIENGVPLQGTWTRAFDEVDLLDIRQPYAVRLPRSVRSVRIKEWESFVIQDSRFTLSAMLCNLKLYRTAMVALYDRETGERLRFRKIIPGGGWRLPRTLWHAAVDSRSWGFFFRIHCWLDAGVIRLDLDVEAQGKRPSFTAHASYLLEETQPTPLAVSLLFSGERSMYAYKVLAPVRGDLVFGGRHIALDPAKTSGLFCDYKGFFPYRTEAGWCCGSGIVGGRRFGFSLGENQAREPYRNNENALWVDGRLTPLPPVQITYPGGPESEWVIQDMEGMVDLVFTPQARLRSRLDLLVSRSDYESPIGYFNGMMVDSQGEKIPVKNLGGVGEILSLRM